MTGSQPESRVRRANDRIQRRARAAQGRWLGTVTRARVSEKLVALTFDDGPNPESTPQVLEALEASGASGTFFMIGRNAEAHPNLVRRVREGNHAVANHTWDHSDFPRLSAAGRRAQLRECARALGGQDGRLFRPPHTHQTVPSHLTARRMGYTVVAWSVEVEDWKPLESSSLADRLRERIRPGSIVVLHDAIWDPISPEAADREPLIQALLEVLPELSRTFRFVTVPKLLAVGEPVKKPWFYAAPEDWR